ncbi:MAG: 23S rRNA (adenine(2503)-C(2))-methyltransferase RlmN [Clostridia bacterium]|nr:23S rRNA (adenine(2503)-C(2))-methyltransferase RlmN [Clostridia bacterium]
MEETKNESAAEKKSELLSMSYDELTELLAGIGEPKYRVSQIFPQLHRGIAPEEMTNISKKTARAISEKAEYRLPEIELKLVSAIDGTVKYLFRLGDGNCIETVLMRYRHGNTVCVSSQVGCRMGCAFCASTIGGKIRDLSAGEILGQIIAVTKDSGERVDNIVMMGIGEPMDNYDNVLKFLKLVNDERGICIGYRHISLSTCGHADGIRKLAAEKLPITLSLSLHAHDDATRSRIMPVNRRWPLAEVLDACREYRDATGRRISFEYTLIEGQNCTTEDAAALAGMLNGALRKGTAYPIHVNLIPVNAVKETGLRPPEPADVRKFSEALEKRGIRATVRRTLGPDINASCGQLRRQTMKDGAPAPTSGKATEERKATE